MRITDKECHSYWNKDHATVLALHEREEKDKYLASCHEMKKNFTLMVYSVDGITGREAKATERCPA